MLPKVWSHLTSFIDGMLRNVSSHLTSISDGTLPKVSSHLTSFIDGTLPKVSSHLTYLRYVTRNLITSHVFCLSYVTRSFMRSHVYKLFNRVCVFTHLFQLLHSFLFICITFVIGHPGPLTPKLWRSGNVIKVYIITCFLFFFYV
jgi:hypothetical protein